MVTGQAIELGLYGQWLRRGFPGFDELRARTRHSGEALVALASDLQPGQLLHLDSQGQQFTMAAIVPLIQAINHATEHRTHVVTILSQQGVAPPRIDSPAMVGGRWWPASASSSRSSRVASPS